MRREPRGTGIASGRPTRNPRIDAHAQAEDRGPQASDANASRRLLPNDKKLDELYDLIDEIEIAMLTTMEADGSLTARPMATQKRRDGVDLWFMTSGDTHKVDVLRKYPQVNVAYYNNKSREWVS